MITLVATATKLSEEIASGRSGRALNKAASAFSDLLATVPDHPVGAFSSSDIDAVRAKAERVIDCLEDRIDTGEDGASLRQQLSEDIDDIRRRLEDIDLWRRDYSV